ncbi:18616_t:CDS:2 [Rhizophagus irregularis]|nr:18616_t:CDS:2 [Rhizophagus irregularis]
MTKLVESKKVMEAEITKLENRNIDDVTVKERINLEKEEEIKIITGPENSKKKKIDTSLSNKKVKDSSDFSSVSYESLKSYSQLDAISNIRSNIAEDGLAENNVLGTNIQLQDTSLLTIPVHTPLRLSLPPRCCEVPSPIVMSNNRYGCGLHFFKKYPDGLTFIRNDNGDFTPKIHPQNKELHAKLTFDRWIKKESKSIFSTRTGISYNFRYIVCNSNRKINPGRTHIYHKLMNNFRSTPSPNSRTAKKQQVRFERSCRRILSQEVIKPGAVSSTSTKLAAAKKGRFLFLPSQKFTAPLRHLHYKKTADIPKQKDYNFTIPHYFSANTNTSKELRTTRNTSNVTESTLIPASNDDLLYTVAPYNPTPDMFISIKYRDIIPPDPIYDNFGSFIVPGSREWFTYMYQLDLNTRDERLEKAEATKFNARMDELYAENQATKLRYQQHQEERSLNIKKLQLEEAARIQTLARYHGTSSNHVLYRQRQAVDLTQWNNDFHYDMSNPQRPTLSKYQKKKSKQKKKLLQSEMDSFLINYPGVSAPLSLKRNTTRSPFEYPYKTFDSEPYTSDDTKEIETRPLKRADHTFSNIHRSHDIYKRSRLDSPLALDSEQAGSSKSSF